MRFQLQLQKDVEPAFFQAFTSPVSSLLSKIPFEKGIKSQKAKTKQKKATNRMVWSNQVFPISVWLPKWRQGAGCPGTNTVYSVCRALQWVPVDKYLWTCQMEPISCTEAPLFIWQGYLVAVHGLSTVLHSNQCKYCHLLSRSTHREVFLLALSP